MKTLPIARAAWSAAVAVALCAAPAFAQNNVAKVHGKVTNPIGQPFSNGDVKFTKDRDEPFDKEKFLNSVPIGADGTYMAPDVAPDGTWRRRQDSGLRHDQPGLREGHDAG